MKIIKVKALTLEGTIEYYSKKNNLYKKNGKFNSISVGAVCKCAGLLYQTPYQTEPNLIIRDSVTGELLSIDNTGDITKDITNIWNTAKTILHNKEVAKEAKKYNL